jgi:hypothetical protein
MPTPPSDNVTILRNAGVIPPEITLAPAYEDAINELTSAEVDAVLSVHGKVGTIEFPCDAPCRLLIF